MLWREGCGSGREFSVDIQNMIGDHIPVLSLEIGDCHGGITSCFTSPLDPGAYYMVIANSNCGV